MNSKKTRIPKYAKYDVEGVGLEPTVSHIYRTDQWLYCSVAVPTRNKTFQNDV